MNELLCEVCYRPGPDRLCSKRCQGLLKHKTSLSRLAVKSAILTALSQIEKDSSLCPGRLAHSVLKSLGLGLTEERDALSLVREILFELRNEKKLRFFQKNVLIPLGKGPWEIRGPIRIKR